MPDRVEILKRKVSEVLPHVDFFIGYGEGFDCLHARPLFVTEESEIDQLIWNEFCIHNLATYLPPQKRGSRGLFNSGEKIGVLIKGCDSRSVVQLLAEKVISRENFVVLGIPCTGKVDLRKLKKINIDNVEAVEITDNSINVTTNNQAMTAKLSEVLYDKCLTCMYPNPLIYDHLIGDPILEKKPGEELYRDVEDFEARSVQERLEYWDREFSRCIRCYACVDVCPTCYCQDQCIAQTRRPRWVSQANESAENKFFQMLRAIHNAGRCTNCGECERVCPMDIPILKINKKLNQEILELFEYQTGVDSNLTPPLLTFKPDELKLKEEK